MSAPPAAPYAGTAPDHFSARILAAEPSGWEFGWWRCRARLTSRPMRLWRAGRWWWRLSAGEGGHVVATRTDRTGSPIPEPSRLAAGVDQLLPGATRLF